MTEEPEGRWYSRGIPAGVHLLVSGGLLVFSTVMIVLGTRIPVMTWEVIYLRILPVILLLEFVLVLVSLGHHLLRKRYRQALLTLVAVVLLILIPVSYFLALAATLG